MEVKTVKFKDNKGHYAMITREQFLKHVKRWRKIRKINERNRIIAEMDTEVY